MHPFQIRHASLLIHQGGIIACPTEAVYGLSCDPLLPEAIERLLELKQRSAEKGLILVASDLSQLSPYVADPSMLTQKNVADSWPGATSWLMPANPDTPGWLTGAHSTIAVRLTAHPVLAELCRQCGTALVSTSANMSCHEPARNALQTRLIFGDSLDWILHGDTGKQSRVSTIYDAVSGKLVRA